MPGAKNDMVQFSTSASIRIQRIIDLCLKIMKPWMFEIFSISQLSGWSGCLGKKEKKSKEKKTRKKINEVIEV